MREILFRGKGTCGLNAGDWIYGYYVKDFWKPTRCGCGIIPIDKERGGYCEVDPSTIGQYTGLTDKNGNKIFDGDILKVKSCDYDYEYLTKVFNNFHTLCVDIYGQSYDFTSIGFADDIWDNENCEIEIIGNIHDNPELLKEEI